jgi:sugar lactone lactonase YvrE
MRVEVALDCRNGVGEGPFWDRAAETLWWVDIPGRKLFRWRPGAGAPQVWPTHDFPSAVVLRRSGGAVVAMRDGLHFFDPKSGQFAPFVKLEPDRPENRTNDAKCDARGDFWVGTMQNNLNEDGSDKPMTGAFGALYRVRPDGEFTREVDGVGLSNTLAWTDDGRTLLFGDTGSNVILAYPVRDDGGLGRPWVFRDAEGLPGYCDGSAIDAEGFLWNARFAGGCLVRLAPDGSLERKLELPVTNPTSCCFGGPDLKTLYVTSAAHGLRPEALVHRPHEGALLTVAVDVPGTPSERFAG